MAFNQVSMHGNIIVKHIPSCDMNIHMQTIM